jgi:molybdopterin-guanine dinucleotide biosynthesis protein A
MVRTRDVADPDGRWSVAGVVLCGGASRRMGSDKALLDFDGERLVDRAVRRLAELAEPVLLACGGRALTVPGCASVDDAVAGAGPLAGIVGGLRRSPSILLAVVAVDMPWFDVELLAQMVVLWNGEDALVPHSPSGPEPLHALYAGAALPAMERALQRGDLRMHDVLDQLRVGYIAAEAVIGVDRAARFATNLNRPDDLLRLTSPPPAHV